MDTTPLPALGSLPLERYILSRWSSLTTMEPNERRRQLALEFVRLGWAGRAQHLAELAERLSEDHVPESQWDNILSPLRTQFQRQLALPSSFLPEGFERFGIVWLRTSYDNNDEAYEKLSAGLNAEMALELEENILDDEALYNYGDDWHRIFEVIPERLFTIVSGDSLNLSSAYEHDTNVETERQSFTAGDFDDYKIEEASERTIPGEERQRTDSEIEANVFRAKTDDLHHVASANYLFVADKQAMETGKVLIVFFDDCGRTVRQARIQPNECEGTAGAWADGFIVDQPEFGEAEIGPDYLPGGICGPPYSVMG